ncbi:MAG: 1,6-anhydro-N-acetylmuramyl-L-alanine amidase AmpD [Alcaligenaceae bacterium]|nr:1,6-anhydro-N-acetylmuramyl-L-alanine amidase AmpD [Alcaligenaceae bacterium]
MNKAPLLLDRHGWLKPGENIKKVPSPNFNERPKHETVSLLVIHNISLPPYQYGGPYIEQLFTNWLNPNEHPFFEQIKSLKVSAHFLIRRTGQIIQFVSTNKRAWHAGVSHFAGREQCNDFSIGIELEGCDFEAFTNEQYESLAQLSKTLKARYTLRAVQGHEHIAPVRKTDPGPFFDWARYRKESGWTRREMPGI